MREFRPRIVPPERTRASWDIPGWDAARVRESLDDSGFAVVRGLLAADVLADLRAAASALMASEIPRSRQVLYVNRPAPANAPPLDSLIHQWLNPCRLAPPCSTRDIARALRERIAELLGGAVLLQDLLLVKRAGHPRFPWHQDFGYWPVDRPHGVILWTPLIASDERTGGLMFAEGSHRRGELPVVDLHTGEPQDDEAQTVDWLGEHEIVAPAFAPGDAALFDPLLLHASPPKHDGPPRAAWSAIWLHPEVRWSAAHAPRHPTRHSFVDGAPVCDVFELFGASVASTKREHT